VFDVQKPVRSSFIAARRARFITDLIAAMVGARADGDGVLTISAVRARLDAAKLRVIRTDETLEHPDPSALDDFASQAMSAHHEQ
jgi:hypothetical protein